SKAMMSRAIATCTTTAEIQMSGPQPMSVHRNRRPTSVLSFPTPQRRLTYRHHATDGPYPTTVSSATYAMSGHPNPDSTSTNNRPPTSEANRIASAPTAAASGRDGWGAAGGASVSGAGTNTEGGAH